jgi:short-subunit dehydrogenase
LLIARREVRLQSIAYEISQQYHVRAEVLAADLTDDEALAAVATRIRESADLGLLVNNAGFGTVSYFVDADPESQDQMHRLHVLAVTRLSHAALTNLVRTAAAGIINVSSVAGLSYLPKCQLCCDQDLDEHFTEGLAIELR